MDGENTWQGMQRITRSVSTGVTASKGMSEYSPDEQDWQGASNKQEEGCATTAFPASAFAGNLSAHTSQVCGSQDGDGGRKFPPTVGEAQICDHLRSLNTRKSMGPDEVHPRVLGELVDGAAKPYSTTLESHGSQMKSDGGCKKGNIAPIF